MIEVKLMIPKAVINYLEAMGRAPSKYFVHAIVETVYEDLAEIEKPGNLIKKYQLAPVFKEHKLDSEFLLNQ